MAEEKIVYVERKPKGLSGCAGLLLLFGLCFVWPIGVALTTDTTSSRTRRRQASRPQRNLAARNAVFSGATVPITHELTWAATSEEGVKTFWQAARAEDDVALARMLFSGQAVELEQGEQVYVVELNLATYKIRLPGEARFLWVVREALE